MRLSNPDLTLLRDSQNHYTDLYLSIFQPSTIFSARVNDASIAKGEREITYDNASGNWQNVKIGSTLLVGSSAGARDKGKIRIKDITSSVITVAENNYIEWGNNQYLTVLNYFDVWPIFPLIVQDPADSEQVIFYKDYDIPYTNQNTVLGAFLNIGPHRAEFIENGSADVYYSASGTYPLSGAISDVQWTFQSGTPSSYNGLNPGYVSYGTPGHYLTQCTVSGTNGWVEIGYRYVSIYDKPDEGTNNPIKLWSVSDVQGSRAEAGYTFSVSVFEPVVVQEGSVIVLFADEWYDGTRKSLGGNALNASKIKFVGYVMDNSIRYDYKDSSVTFDVGSITQIMKEMEGFAIEIKSVANPSTWTEMANINAKKATYHYWKWHSNVISLADIEFVGDDFLVQYFDSDRESLFDSVDNFLRSAYHASAVSDKQGKIWLETDAWARPNATGTYSSILNLSKYDWIGEPTIREQRYPELSYLEYNGIAYSGVSTGTYVPLMANAPGDAPAYRGKSERRTGLALLGQSQLNQLVGDEFTHRNTQFPVIDFRMRGNWSNLDIAPQEALQVDISASDTVRNVGISGLYMPSSITWNFDSDTKTFIPRCTFSAITSGEPGETIVIPEIVDDGGYGGRLGGGVGQFPLVPSTPVITSFYSALKLETFGGLNKALPTSKLVEVPLTYIEFSSEGLPPGTASGTFTGANIIPVIGASGTYGVNYGFYSSYPGIYRASYNLVITYTDIHAPLRVTPIEAHISSNSPTLGVLSDYTITSYNIGSGGDDSKSMQGNTLLNLPAGGIVSFYVINYGSVTMKLDRAVAFLEFLAYG